MKEALLAQGIPEADRVAQALDLYVNGSLNFFNQPPPPWTSATALSALTYKGLGKNLKKPGMLIVQDAVWNTVTINRAIVALHLVYFVDEFHLLLKEEQTAAYSAEIWKRFRKWGGVPTGATQNPKDLLSSPEIENILENSDFIYMLNQAAGDRKILAERLGYLSGTACLCDQFRAGPWAAVLQLCDPALCGRLPQGHGALQAAHHKHSEVEHAAETENDYEKQDLHYRRL